MKGYRISILRHGRTEANEKGIYIGKTDLPLSEAGKAQLKELYETHEYPKVQKVYTSPLERAVQSAEILFPDRELTEADDLREMDFGIFEGLKAEDLVNLDSYKKWLKGGLDNPPPNGESLRNMMVRCYTALNAIILDMMNEGITHAGVMTHSGILMNIPDDLYEAARIDGASPFVTFRKITMPYVLFVTTPYLITQLVGNINNFNVIYLLSAGKPTPVGDSAGKTDLLVTWLYKLTIDNQEYNIGAVIGILTFIVLSIVALVTYRNTKSYKDEEGFM